LPAAGAAGGGPAGIGLTCARAGASGSAATAEINIKDLKRTVIWGTKPFFLQDILLTVSFHTRDEQRVPVTPGTHLPTK
jgi:hypothetical protein